MKGADPGHWAFDLYEPSRGGSPVNRKKLTSRDKNLINGKPGPESAHTRGGGSEFSWGPTSVGKEGTRDYQTAQWAADQLKAEHEKPFFLAVGLSKPHLPFYVPQEFYDLKNDPMEWRNLMGGELSAPALAGKERLEKLVPTKFAKGVPVQNSAEKARLKKTRALDQTIKARRRLAELK